MAVTWRRYGSHATWIADVGPLRLEVQPAGGTYSAMEGGTWARVEGVWCGPFKTEKEAKRAAVMLAQFHASEIGRQTQEESED